MAQRVVEAAGRGRAGRQEPFLGAIASPSLNKRTLKQQVQNLLCLLLFCRAFTQTEICFLISGFPAPPAVEVAEEDKREKQEKREKLISPPLSPKSRERKTGAIPKVLNKK